MRYSSLFLSATLVEPAPWGHTEEFLSLEAPRLPSACGTCLLQFFAPRAYFAVSLLFFLRYYLNASAVYVQQSYRTFRIGCGWCRHCYPARGRKMSFLVILFLFVCLLVSPSSVYLPTFSLTSMYEKVCNVRPLRFDLIFPRFCLLLWLVALQLFVPSLFYSVPHIFFSIALVLLIPLSSRRPLVRWPASSLSSPPYVCPVPQLFRFVPCFCSLPYLCPVPQFFRFVPYLCPVPQYFVPSHILAPFHKFCSVPYFCPVPQLFRFVPCISSVPHFFVPSHIFIPFHNCSGFVSRLFSHFHTCIRSTFFYMLLYHAYGDPLHLCSFRQSHIFFIFVPFVPRLFLFFFVSIRWPACREPYAARNTSCRCVCLCVLSRCSFGSEGGPGVWARRDTDHTPPRQERALVLGVNLDHIESRWLMCCFGGVKYAAHRVVTPFYFWIGVGLVSMSDRGSFLFVFYFVAWLITIPTHFYFPAFFVWPFFDGNEIRLIAHSRWRFRRWKERGLWLWL